MRVKANKTTGFEKDSGPLNIAIQQKYHANFRNSRQMKTGSTFANTFAPSNFEISAARHGFDPGNQATIKDFL